MAFTKPPARRGTGDFFPVAKRPYTRKPPTGPGSDNSPYYYGGGGRKPGPSVPKPDRAPGLAPGQATPDWHAPQTSQPQATQAAATAGAKADALSQYLAGITDPAERAYVAAQIGPQIAALNAQRDALNQQAAAQQQVLQGFTQALIEHIKGIDYSGQYADIANSQVAAGQAAGESLAAANPQGGTAAILNAIGAPGQQAADLEKLNRDVFTGGGAVLTGTGGTIPSFQTAGEGVGVLGWAAAQPGIAAATGEENMRQLLASEAEAQGKVTSDLQAVLAGIPKAQADFATQQAQAKTDAENRAMSLYNSGLITQRELARQLKLPNWQKYPDTPRGSATAPKIYKDGQGYTYALDPATGKVTRLPGAPKPAAGAKPTRLTFQNINGEMWGIDPFTGEPKVDLGPAGTPKQNKKGAKPQPIYRVGNDGRTYLIDPKTNTATLVPGMPGKADTPAGARFSPQKILEYKGNAERLAKNVWFGIRDKKDNKKFASPPLHYQQAMAEMRKAGIPLEFAQAALNRWWTKPGFERDIKQFSEKGRVYFYRGRGTGEGRPLNPKVPAAAETAAGASLVDYAKEQIGQPYVWGGESRKEGGFDCSGLVDYALRQQGYTGPRVTTYTLAKMGTSVKGQGLQPGDIIISNGGKHVVMYAGNGQVIAAPHRGAKVQYQPLSRFDGSIVDVRRLAQGGTGPQYASNTSAQSPQAARALGQTMAVGYGWQGREWSALDQLWTHESGWDYQSHNKKGSGAQGIPQALGHSLPSDYATNPRTQIEWGLNYIKNTFRTPSRAWAFWRATVNRNANLAPPDLRSKAQYWIAHGYTGY